MASILITDTPITKALEEQNSKDFEALWDILKIGTIRGYITPNDLQQLEQHLYDSVGEDFAQKLLAGFRSVLGIYGEPDHPIIDLIIDGESVDELADEIPIRSVSDFLYIYELERLLATSPGEEILDHSLFSSLSDILEVLDGEDAFVSKALMNAIVPVDDAPTLASSSHLPSAGAIAISSKATTEEEPALENSLLTDGFVNSDEQSDTLPLSPVIQAILNSANPSGPSTLDLRFGPERADEKELLTHRLMTPTHTSPSIYDFNVDMFLILGLIMQMAENDDHGLDRNSHVQRALLTRKMTLSHSTSSTKGGVNASSSTSDSLPIAMESEGFVNPIGLILDDIAPSEGVQTDPPFHHQKSDRQFELDRLSDGHYKTTAKNALGSDENAHHSSLNSSNSNDVSESTGQLHTPVSHPEDSSPQTYPSSNSLGESRRIQQSSDVHRSTAPQFSGESDASITQMDPMLSGVEQPLTSPMVNVQDTSNNIRALSNSTVTETSAYHLKNTLKFINERKKAANERGNPFGQSDEQTLPRPATATTTTTNSGRGSDDIYAVEGTDTIAGGQGEDFIEVIDSTTTIAGGRGGDFIVARDSTTTIEGGKGNDFIDLYSVTDTTANGGNGRDEVYINGTNNTVNGGNGMDLISVFGGTNTVNSGQQGDSIYVRRGKNSLKAGQGADYIEIDGGKNSLQTGQGTDQIYIYGGKNSVESENGNDYIGIYDGQNSLKAGQGADYIEVYGGQNSIEAGNGDDLIVVYGGTHTISGGNGQDLFVLEQNDDVDTIPITDVEPDPEHVVITDFAQEQDTLELLDTAADELKLEQVGLNTHIFAGDDLLAVLESVERDNLLVTGAQIEEPSLGDLPFSIFIRWESSEIIQEFEQAENLVATGEGVTDPGEGVFPGPFANPSVKDIWLVDVSGDI